MPQLLNNRVKIGCVAPCIGVGGADALMMGLMRYCYNLEFTGLAILGEINIQNVQNYQRWTNWLVPIHQQAIPNQLPGIHYHASFEDAVYHAVKDANLIFTWSTPGLEVFLKNIDLPVVEYIQNEDEQAERIVLVNLLSTDYKVACSKAAAQCLPEPDRATIIYNGIDPGRVVPRKGRDIQRRLWRISDEQKILLFMGRLEPEKHPEVALQALRYLAENWVVVFCGDGTQKDILKRDAKKYFPDRVAFVKPEYHVGDILASADCFILPSDYEGHPLALMEAMLAGTPCVYTDFNVMKELHDTFGEIGTMIPKKQTGDIYAEAVLNASQEMTKARLAREMVWQNFTLPTIACQWEEYFETVLFRWLRDRRITPIYPIGQ